MHFADPGPVFERLGRSIGILGGGPYSFVNPASVTGVLGLIDDQYMLSDVEHLDVWESKRLRMKPLPQLQKRPKN